MNTHQIEALFTYHPPVGNQARRYNEIRQAGLEFAMTINRNTLESAEQTLAIRAVHLAVMQANASIAVNEREDANGPA